jgi:hypothetical protein
MHDNATAWTMNRLLSSSGNEKVPKGLFSWNVILLGGTTFICLVFIYLSWYNIFNIIYSLLQIWFD